MLIIKTLRLFMTIRRSVLRISFAIIIYIPQQRASFKSFVYDVYPSGHLLLDTSPCLCRGTKRPRLLASSVSDIRQSEYFLSGLLRVNRIRIRGVWEVHRRKDQTNLPVDCHRPLKSPGQKSTPCLLWLCRGRNCWYPCAKVHDSEILLQRNLFKLSVDMDPAIVRCIYLVCVRWSWNESFQGAMPSLFWPCQVVPSRYLTLGILDGVAALFYFLQNSWWGFFSCM
jgi:hypothetical protein